MSGFAANIPVTALARQIQDSPTLGMAGRVRLLREAGVEVHDMTVGAPHRSISLDLDRYEQTGAKYGPTLGTAIRESVARYVARLTALEVRTANIAIVGGGTKGAIANFARTVLNPGDTILLVSPYWPSYFEIFRGARATVGVIETTVETGFKLNPELLETALHMRPVKALVLNSPSNPTGVTYTRAELEGLAEVLRRLSPTTIILSDEIYADYVFSGVEHVSMASVAPDLPVVIVGGFAKTFGRMGDRVGWLAASAEFIAILCNRLSNDQGNPPHAAMLAMASLYDDQMHFPAELARLYEANVVVFQKLLGAPPLDLISVPVPPNGGLYVFANATKTIGRSLRGQRIRTSGDLANVLLDEFRVAVVDGAYFGANGMLRMSVAMEQLTLKSGLAALRIALSELN